MGSMKVVFDVLFFLNYVAIGAAAVSKHSAIGCMYALVLLAGLALEAFLCLSPFVTSRVSLAIAGSALLCVVGFQIAKADNAVSNPDSDMWVAVGLETYRQALTYGPDLVVLVLGVTLELLPCCLERPIESMAVSTRIGVKILAFAALPAAVIQASFWAFITYFFPWVVCVLTYANQAYSPSLHIASASVLPWIICCHIVVRSIVQILHEVEAFECTETIALYGICLDRYDTQGLISSSALYVFYFVALLHLRSLREEREKASQGDDDDYRRIQDAPIVKKRLKPKRKPSDGDRDKVELENVRANSINPLVRESRFMSAYERQLAAAAAEATDDSAGYEKGFDGWVRRIKVKTTQAAMQALETRAVAKVIIGGVALALGLGYPSVFGIPLILAFCLAISVPRLATRMVTPLLYYTASVAQLVYVWNMASLDVKNQQYIGLLSLSRIGLMEVLFGYSFGLIFYAIMRQILLKPLPPRPEAPCLPSDSALESGRKPSQPLLSLGPKDDGMGSVGTIEEAAHTMEETLKDEKSDEKSEKEAEELSDQIVTVEIKDHPSRFSKSGMHGSVMLSENALISRVSGEKAMIPHEAKLSLTKPGAQNRRNSENQSSMSPAGDSATSSARHPRAEWYFLVPLISNRRRDTAVSRLGRAKPDSNELVLRPGHNSRFQWMFQAARSGVVVQSRIGKGSAFIFEPVDDTSRRFYIKTKGGSGGVVYDEKGKERKSAHRRSSSNLGKIPKYYYLYAMDDMQLQTVTEKPDIEDLFGQFYIYPRVRIHGHGDGEAYRGISSLCEGIRVCIRAAGAREHGEKKGGFWSVEKDDGLWCKSKQPKPKDVFKISKIANKNNEFRIQNNTSDSSLHVLTVWETEDPPRYYVCNKNGREDRPLRLMCSAKRDKKSNLIISDVPTLGIGSDVRFLWRISTRSDRKNIFASVSIRSELGEHATLQFETVRSIYRHVNSPKSIKGGSPSPIPRSRPQGNLPIFTSMELKLENGGSARWVVSSVPEAHRKDGLVDWEFIKVMVLARIWYLFIWVEIATLILMYTMACITVDLLHAVYLAFFALIIVFTTIRKHGWVAVVVYSSTVVLILYSYQLKSFESLHGEIPDFVGIKNVNTVGWSALWPHILVVFLSTMSWATHQHKQERDTTLVSSLPLPNKEHVASLIVTLGFIICVVMLIIVGIFFFGHNVSILNGVYIILAFAIMVTITFYPEPIAHRLQLRRVLYFAAIYAGACLVFQYVYQFGILKPIDELLDSIRLSQNNAGISKSKNLITALAGHSIILFVVVLQIRVSNAYKAKFYSSVRAGRSQGSLDTDLASDPKDTVTQGDIRPAGSRPLMMNCWELNFWFLKLIYRMCLLHTEKGLAAAMFWASATNVSLFGLWRLLLALLLVWPEANPGGLFCRFKTILILGSEQVMLVTMFLYNLLQNIIHSHSEDNCGPPPLNSQSCPREAILGIWAPANFGSAVSFNLLIIFLACFHGICRYELHLIIRTALAFVSRGRNGPEQVEFLTRSGRSRTSGKTQTEKKNTRSEGDLKTKFSDGKQGDGKHADGEGVLKSVRPKKKPQLYRLNTSSSLEPGGISGGVESLLDRTLMYDEEGQVIAKFNDLLDAPHTTAAALSSDPYITTGIIQLLLSSPNFESLYKSQVQSVQENKKKTEENEEKPNQTEDTETEGIWISIIPGNEIIRDAAELLSHFVEMWALQISLLVLAWTLWEHRADFLGFAAMGWLLILLRKYNAGKVFFGGLRHVGEKGRVWFACEIFWTFFLVAYYCVFIYWIEHDQNGYKDKSDQEISRNSYIDLKLSENQVFWSWLEFFGCAPRTADAVNSLTVVSILVYILIIRHRHIKRRIRIEVASPCVELNPEVNNTKSARAPTQGSILQADRKENKENIIDIERGSDASRMSGARLSVDDSKVKILMQQLDRKEWKDDLKPSDREDDLSEKPQQDKNQHMDTDSPHRDVSTMPWYLNKERDYTIGEKLSDKFLLFWFRDFENINKVMVLGLGSGFFNLLNFGYMVFALFLLRLTGKNNIIKSASSWKWLAVYNLMVIFLRLSFRMPWSRYLPDKSDADTPPFTWPSFFGVYVDWNLYSALMSVDVAILLLTMFQNYLNHNPRMAQVVNRQMIERSQELEHGERYRAEEERNHQRLLQEYEDQRRERTEALEELREERRRFKARINILRKDSLDHARKESETSEHKQDTKEDAKEKKDSLTEASKEFDTDRKSTQLRFYTLASTMVEKEQKLESKWKRRNSADGSMPGAFTMGRQLSSLLGESDETITEGKQSGADSSQQQPSKNTQPLPSPSLLAHVSKDPGHVSQKPGHVSEERKNLSPPMGWNPKAKLPKKPDEKGHFLKWIRLITGYVSWFGIYIGQRLNQMSWSITTFCFCLCFAFEPSIFSAALPISLFSYVALVSPRVHTNYWRGCLLYTVSVILLLFTFQLPIFCICKCDPRNNEQDTYQDVWTCQEVSPLALRRCREKSCGNTANIDFWGLRKFDDGGHSGGSAGGGGHSFSFFAGAFWYFLVLLALLNQRYWLRKNGLWKRESDHLNSGDDNSKKEEKSDQKVWETEEEKKLKGKFLKEAEKDMVTSSTLSERVTEEKEVVFAFGSECMFFFDGSWLPAKILGLHHVSQRGTRPPRSAGRRRRDVNKPGNLQKRRPQAKTSIVSHSKAKERGQSAEQIVISFRYLSHDQRAIIRPYQAQSLLAPKPGSYRTDRPVWIGKITKKKTSRSIKGFQRLSDGVWSAGTLARPYTKSVEIRIVAKGNPKARVLARKVKILKERETWCSWIFRTGPPPGKKQSGVEEVGGIYETLDAAKRMVLSLYREETANDKVGVDLYGYTVAVQVLMFLVVLIFYDDLRQFTQGFAKSQVSAGYVLSLFSVFLWICVDRVVYLYRSLFGKLTIQIISLTCAMGILLSEGNLSAFQTTLFLLCSAYWAIGALQFKLGYPPVILPSLMSTHWFMALLFNIYRAIPFVFELRTLLDWSCNDTVLFFNEWLKLEDLWATFYQVQCDLSWKYVATQVPGIPQPTWRKCTCGWLLFLILALVVWGPLFLFVSGPRAPLGLSQVSVTTGIPGYPPFTSTDQLKQYNIDGETWKIWRSTYSFLLNQDRSSLRSFALQYPNAATTWPIAQGALKQLQIALNTTIAFKVSVQVLRESSRGKSTELFEFQQSLTDPEKSRLNTLLDAAEIGDKSHLPGDVNISRCYPQFLYLPDTGGPYALSTEDRSLANCTLIIDSAGNFSQGSGSIWFYFLGPEIVPENIIPDPNAPKVEIPTSGSGSGGTDYRQATFQIFSDRLVALGSISLALIPLYITFVYAVGQFVRLMVTGASANIMYKDLGDARPLLALIKLIYLARADGQLDLEEFLYVELINILKSGQMILKMTGDYSRVFPTILYARRVKNESEVCKKTVVKNRHNESPKKRLSSMHQESESKYNKDEKITMLPVGCEVEIKTEASTKIKTLRSIIAQKANIDIAVYRIDLYHGSTLLENQSDVPGRRPHNNVSERKLAGTGARTGLEAVLYNNRIYDYAIRYKALIQFVVVKRGPEDLDDEDAAWGD